MALSNWEYWNLANGQPVTRLRTDQEYVTPPTSLVLQAMIMPGVTVFAAAVSKDPALQNVTQGRIITNSFTVGQGSAGWLFGCVYIGVRAPNNVAVPWSLTHYGGWQRYRVTWLNDVNDYGEPALLVVEEHEVGGQWVETRRDYEAPLLGTINRCGIGWVGMMSYSVGYGAGWTDDTQIWRVV